LRVLEVSTIYCTVNVGHLADALLHLASPSLKRVVAFTSTSIATKMDSEVAIERQNIQNFAKDEERLIAICQQLGVAWTVLRPTLIYDEGKDQNVSRLAALIRRLGFVPLYGRASGLRQPVHAQDLAIGAIRAAHNDAAKSKVYDLPGKDTISYHEMVGRIFDGMGRRRMGIALPPLLWKLAFNAASPFFPNANIAMGTRMAKDMIFDPAPATQDFGWQPRGFRPKFSTGDGRGPIATA
jgi:nucleoside-diphosphate-sugar epimerase